MKNQIAKNWAVLLSLAIASATVIARADESWPRFRGPDGVGTSANTDLPDTWSDTKNVLWKTDVAGRGWSSPIVAAGRVFLTTAVDDGKTETVRKGLYFGGNRRKPPTSVHHWKIVCLELSSGKLLWQQTAHKGVPLTPRHLKNSYASETPVTDGQRVYVVFGNVGVFCYTIDGKRLWQRPIRPHKMRYGWGTAASPVLDGDRLFIVNDNENSSELLALDAVSGDLLWRIDRQEKSNWATPFVWKNKLRTELITPGTGKIRSYDLDGKLLYELGGCSSITIATPYADSGLLYISSGYILGFNKPIFALRPGASGDISLTGDETSNEFIAWSHNQTAPYNPTTLVYQGLLYVLRDRGFFVCYDAKTGEEVYGRQRLPGGKAFSASPWAYDGKIFCLNEYGVTFVVKAGREFELLHTNKLADDPMCMATPAMAGERLLLRTNKRLYCFEKGAKPAG